MKKSIKRNFSREDQIMKKSLKNAVCLLALVAITTPSFATITGSPHDFSGAGWNTSGEKCNVCHAPHNAAQGTLGPLWNHEPTTQTFTVYTSVTMSTQPGQPAASSKLCLSCHDGTIALDSYGGTTAGTNFVTGDALIGSDISQSHPISFTYDEDDPGIKLKSTTVTGIGTVDDMLLGGMVECASCHDVHDSADQGTDGSLLVMPNTGSDLCLACHDK
jgi:predicted CXXCH cytochrome family protein